MTYISKYISVLIVACIGLVSCTDLMDNNTNSTNFITVDVELATLSANTSENELDDVKAFMFSDGILKKEIGNVEITDGGQCRIDAEFENGDNLYFISQAGKVIGNIIPDNEEEFLMMNGKAYNNESTPVFISGGTSLSKNAANSVTLLRGVSRIDLNISGENIEVRKVEFSNIAAEGRIFAQDNGEIQMEEARTTLVRDFTDSPLTGSCTGILYAYEQKSDGENKSMAIITYTVDGVEKSANVELPSLLQRNKIYKLNLVKATSVVLTVSVEQWGYGENTDLAPDLTTKILIDTSDSVIPEGASFSQEGDTLFFTPDGGTATIRFSSFAEVECISLDEEVVVTKVEGEESNKFTINASPRSSGQSTGYIDLKIKQKGMVTTVNNITVVIPANAIQLFKDAELTQAVAFVNNGIDYGKYVDGTLGYFVVPEGSNVTTEGIWIRLDKADDIIKEGKDVYRVEGGFKPNDPEADGREQVATVTIDTETYTFRRLNWGLPVVEINGVYWCKYNLRGNVKRFEDQISISTDQNTVKSLETFLREYPLEHPGWPGWDVYVPNSVKSMELFYMMLGQGYQSGNPDGMVYRAGSGSKTDYSYIGYDTYYPEEETGLLPAETMAPDGYKIPENSDFRKLVPNENFSLGNAGTTSSYTVNGVNMTVEIFTMPSMSFNTTQFFGLEGDQFIGEFSVGGVYGRTNYYFFRQEGMSEPLVLMGHPYQFQPLDGGSQTAIKQRELLFVCHDSAGKAWYINGSDDTQPVYFKSVTGNQMNNVKMIRCVKKPVNYIIK